MLDFRFPFRKSVVVAACLLVCSPTSGDVVINEINYEPRDNCDELEFIELFNSGSEPVALGAWRFSNGVGFEFPAGTMIGAGSYLVVAQNPARLRQEYGIEAVGPWTGRISNEGERIELEDAMSARIDEVDFRVGFPWPIGASGRGSSMELINPGLDNDLGSSWRSSRSPGALDELTYFAESSEWRWRKGSSEASDPPEAWRVTGFVEDESWFTGPAPVGFGNVTGTTINTTLDDMQNNYSSVFGTREFTVEPGEIPAEILLRYTIDDGLIVWINSHEVLRKRMSAGAHAFDAISSRDANQIPRYTEGGWYEESLTSVGGFVVEGTNTIAVHAFNGTLGGSDFSFDLSLVRPATPEPEPAPSPGRRNTIFKTNAPPNIRQVKTTPEMPSAAEETLVTAKITDPDGIGSVDLHCQVVSAGNYLPSRLPLRLPISDSSIRNGIELPGNPEYEDPENWTTISMNDDGIGGDAVADDAIFSAHVPAQSHRSLVRYRISLTDSSGTSAQAPFNDDDSRNFAYFVYDGIPQYNGHSVEVLESLPVYHLITRAEDWEECRAYSGGDQIPQGTLARFYYNWPGTIVYNGKVYDNIRYRLRGANGRYHVQSKRSMRFRFNKGNHFQARDQSGGEYPQKWRTLTTGKCFDNRQTLTYALNEAVTMFFYNQIGVPAVGTHWIHWRVIDDEAEAPDQWRGDFQGIKFVMETYDVRFLDSHNLERGNLYKLINQTTSAEQQKRYQAVGAVKNGEDHNNIESRLDGGDSAAYIRAHVNLDKWNLFHGFVEAVRYYDYWPSANKNMVYYFEPDYLPKNGDLGKLWIFPWDTDATWGPTYNSGHDVVYNALFQASGGGADGNSTPELWPEYFNVVREIRDLLWQPDQIEPVIDQFAAVLAPMVAPDADRWKRAPGDAGNYNGLGGRGASSLDALVQDMKNFAFVGGDWPGGGVGAGGRARHLDNLQGSQGERGRIPATPAISYSGEPGFPINGLALESTSFRDPQGAGSFGAMKWRLAEITPLGGRALNIFGAGQDWTFLDNGSDQGTAWRETGFDDGAWASGAAPLGYGRIRGTDIVTELSFGLRTDLKYVTSYFRKEIGIVDIESFEEFIFKIHSDDGVVVYLNGTEVLRAKMPAGAIGFDTLASAAGDEGEFNEFAVPASAFVEGANLIAVELHQDKPGSSDLVFDMALDGKELLLPPGTDSVKLEWDAEWESELTEFTGSITIPANVAKPDTPYRARVKHRDDTGRWSHWSEPLEFTTSTFAVSPWMEGLVISELMYNPAAATEAERALGYATSDFEYVEVCNIGNAALDLTNLRFTKGVDYEFSSSDMTTIDPGAYVLVVRNQAAFESRYGTGLPVAGIWDAGDNLSNGGERVKLSYGAGVGIRDFDFGDELPWPAAADGDGFSLVLIDPASGPDHRLPASWRASSAVGGSPGTSEPTPGGGFSAWLSENGLDANSASEDPDRDLLSNFMEYATGSAPRKPSTTALPSVEYANGAPTFTYRRNKSASDVTFSIESATDLKQWRQEEGSVISTIDNADGSETVSVRLEVEDGAAKGLFLRLRVTL
jgi:hypothetical protein